LERLLEGVYQKRGVNVLVEERDVFLCIVETERTCIGSGSVILLND
jgi:hypothetical protein